MGYVDMSMDEPCACLALLLSNPVLHRIIMVKSGQLRQRSWWITAHTRLFQPIYSLFSQSVNRPLPSRCSLRIQISRGI